MEDFSLSWICTRTVHGIIDEVKVYSVFCKTTSLFETLHNIAMMMGEDLHETEFPRS